MQNGTGISSSLGQKGIVLNFTHWFERLAKVHNSYMEFDRIIMAFFGT
jgi:hypothetical protein